MVASVASTTAAATSASEAGSKSLAQNFDTFLKLLTTQLQHQDPLKPMDSDKFTEQLVSFSGVEQQISTNKNLESLISMMTASTNTSASNLIGKTIEAQGNAAVLTNGKASWSYDLPKTADKVAVTVLDSNNNIVFQGSGEKGSGTHTFDWNGRNSGGTAVSPGTYKLQVSAVDAAGETITPTLNVRGTVEGVEFSNGNTVLVVGARRVNLSDVASVHAATN